MIVLGIESTAHTLGAGITENKRVLANVRDIYQPASGGIHPREATLHHENVADNAISQALAAAGIEENDIDAVAYSAGPGIPGCLWVGLRHAKSISEKLGIPLIPVNHCIAHIEIGKAMTGAKDPVTLYVSGGNTQVLALVGGRYRVFGETQDIGIGNALDKLGRAMGLQHPGGPKIEQLAINGRWVELPYIVKGMDMSFSGILTQAEKMLKKHNKNDISFSFQETCFSMLTEVTERAVAHTEKDEVLLTGGVAANMRLQEMLSIMCKERGAEFYIVPKEYAGDNGVMIAWTGMLIYQSGRKFTESEITINKFWRTDEVEITWI